MAPSPYTIGGNLNFGTAAPLEDYQGAYQNALNLNSQMYQNILGGYQGLNSSVLGNLSATSAGRAQEIEDQFAQQTGAAKQGLISKGLGNTTVQNAVQRGINLDKSKAQNNLTSQIANLYAQYQAQLGGQQLGWMNSVNAPYPNPQVYAQLAMQRGMLEQMRRMPMTPQPLGGGGWRSTGPAAPLRAVGSMGGGGGSSGGGYAGMPSPYNAPPRGSAQQFNPMEDGGYGGGGGWGPPNGLGVGTPGANTFGVGTTGYQTPELGNGGGGGGNGSAGGAGPLASDAWGASDIGYGGEAAGGGGNAGGRNPMPFGFNPAFNDVNEGLFNQQPAAQRVSAGQRLTDFVNQYGTQGSSRYGGVQPLRSPMGGEGNGMDWSNFASSAAAYRPGQEGYYTQTPNLGGHTPMPSPQDSQYAPPVMQFAGQGDGGASDMGSEDGYGSGYGAQPQQDNSWASAYQQPDQAWGDYNYGYYDY